MPAKLPKLRRLLWPCAWLYGVGVRIRNLFFDRGLLPSRSYPVPVICVGNLTAGGSGKTPMVEYLVRLLKERYRTGVLSRGYKRKTRGYVLAGDESTGSDIGDESSQIKYKYPDVTVAVDANRRRGIRNLLALPEDRRPQVILLDDGFQHRYVRPSLSLLITDCGRLYCRDRLLPAGWLREPASGADRAEVVVVSKCDASLSPAESRNIRDALNLNPQQSLFFSSIAYLPFRGVFPEACAPGALDSLQKDDSILLVTGIARPAPLIEAVKKRSERVEVMSFADHHAFGKKDIRRMKTALQRMAPTRPLILCTEKDAARIRHNPCFPEAWRSRMYYVPVEVKILFDRSEQLDELVLQHVRFLIENMNYTATR
ncbi:MAG: tetraacyldisaccharide 4'-kinase [Tannerella sp.]|nr:tetraacyldisaccharide 4'-kinase [Tannerella sp.]